GPRGRAGDLPGPAKPPPPARARPHRRVVRRPRRPAAAGATGPPGRCRPATAPGRGGVAVGAGSRSAGAGRGPGGTVRPGSVLQARYEPGAPGCSPDNGPLSGLPPSPFVPKARLDEPTSTGTSPLPARVDGIARIPNGKPN